MDLTLEAPRKSTAFLQAAEAVMHKGVSDVEPAAKVELQEAREQGDNDAPAKDNQEISLSQAIKRLSDEINA